MSHIEQDNQAAEAEHQAAAARAEHQAAEAEYQAAAREGQAASKPYAVVIGAANMDIAGRPSNKLVMRDSNPGVVRVSAGGAGRNIAHNLALLGADVRLITAFGEDSHARELTHICEAAGIDVSDSVVIPGAASSTYLFIMDETGDMELAVSDMSIYEQLVPSVLEPKLDLIEGAAVCVVDTNIPSETLTWIATQVTTPIFCDPVSTAKATKLETILGSLHTLKPNRFEAKTLAKMSIDDDTTLERAADRLLDTGLEQVFISLDTQGLFCANHEQKLMLPTIEGPVVNATGAGDAMTAAITWAFLGGHNLLGQGQAGLAAASLCVEASDTINMNMSAQALHERMSAKI